MSALKFYTLWTVSFLLGTATSSPALSAIQHVNPRDEYQGGWPLSLEGTNSGSCPTDASTQCSSTNVNPQCCPSGQTCFWGAVQFANYCCPTDADCNTAVLNFPRCANSTWNMFTNGYGSFFCCEPGALGVVPKAGTTGGICEPSDQAVPTSLLATMVSQVGVATPTPTATVSASNATTTGGSGTPAETNPSLAPSSTSTGGDGILYSTSSGIASWSKPLKIGVGTALAIFFVAVVALCSLCNRRRRRNLGYVQGYEGSVDEFGVSRYQSSYGLGGLYRRERPTENNVTVNVVQGDMQH